MRLRVPRAAWLVALLFALAASIPGAAPAQTPPSDMGVSITPSLSTSATNLPWGWTSVVVSITNNSSAPAHGEARAALQQFGDKRSFESRAPYAVAAGATVSVKLPVNVVAYAQVSVAVVDSTRGQIATASFSPIDSSAVVLLDVAGSQLKGAINDTPVVTLYEPSGRTSRGSAGAPTIGVAAPRVDAATGDPILPDRAALYDAVDAVLVRSDMLAKMGSAEVEALAGFVLAGGTIAIAITRPEDVRNPTIAAFAGGEVTQTAVSSEALRQLVLAKPSVSSTRDVPLGLAPGEDMGKALSGYRGGNLRGSIYGNSAPYGLGEVHLLAFDPTKKPGLDDNWAKVRMIDLARRAYDRRASVVFRPGENDESRDIQKVRKELDPNEGSRWAIAAAAVLLLIYAVLAAPVNYSIAAKKNKPLSAIRLLPIFSAIMFFVIVGIGVLAKGVSGRSRRLSLVEAGAGMSKATIRRYRGFYASRAKELTVRTSDATSLVRTALVSEPGEIEDRLVVDREGARLESVNALPWQTLVIREDGVTSIGDGISILKKDPSGATVKNRSGHNLRGVLLRLPGGEVRYFSSIADGDGVDASAGREIGGVMKERPWISAIGTTHPAGVVRVRPLGAHALAPILDDDAPGLGDAWQALELAAESDCSWFLDDVPVLLAQMDGGEGKSSDSGLRLERDRLLVRVVGYGGAP